MKTQLRFLKAIGVLFISLTFCFSFKATANSTSEKNIILNFNGAQVSNSVKLSWEISNYNPTTQIQVEKSMDGVTWELEGAYNLDQKEHEDANPVKGYQYYRLKQIDSPLEFYYSNIVAIDFASKAEQQVMVYPNPTKGQFCVKLPMEKIGLASIKIYTYDFQQVTSFETTFDNGIHIDFSSKPNGIYCMEILHNGIMQKIRFVKE